MEFNRFKKLRSHISEIEGKILSARGLSRLLGVANNLISRMEKGDLPPSPKVAARLEEKYGISREWFLTGEGLAPWEEKTQDELFKIWANMEAGEKLGKAAPGDARRFQGIEATLLLLHGPAKRLVDFMIEAARNDRFALYIYNVLESAAGERLDQLTQKWSETALPLAEKRVARQDETTDKVIAKIRNLKSEPVPYNRAAAGPEIKQVAEPARLAARPERTFEPTEVKLKIPDPPDGLTGEDRRRWEYNAATLQRWMQTSGAFWCPSWALERFCREVVHFYAGAEIGDVGGLLKDFIEEGRK